MGVNGIYGLSGSGFDVESMVKTAMKAKQAQYDKMYKKEVQQEWIKSAYSDFYSSMTTFQYSTLSNYKMQSNMSAMAGTSSDSKVATVTANGDAAAMTHKITVNSQTTNAYLQTTTAGISRDTASTSTTKSVYLKDIISSQLGGGIKGNYDSTADTVTLNDGTVISNASTTAAISFNIKDSATSSTTTSYTTTTKDASGNIIAGFVPGTDGASGTYTAADGTKYTTTTTDSTDGSGNVTTVLTPTSGGTAVTYITTTLNDKTGVVVSNFHPAVDGSTTSTSGSTTTTTTTTTNSAGTIGTSIIANEPNTGSPVVYTYKDLAEKTLNDLALDISRANGNVTATYDSLNDSLSIYNKNGGSANLISISAFTGSYTTADGKTATAATSTTMTNALFNHLNLGMYDGNTLNAAQTMTDASPLSAVGSSGSITIDGKTYSNLASNKVTVAGVSYTLVGTGTSTVTVSQDTDTIIKNVKQFVTDYNKMLDSLNDKIYETNYVSGSKANTSYMPLTDTEKKAMSESEVSTWETKAKKGLLYNSSVLKNIVTSMRSALSTPVDAVSSKYNTLGSIGISSSTNKGHIQLDEEKLKKALTADPDAVYQLFASGSTSTSTDSTKQGVAVRLDGVMKTALSTISAQAGTSATTNDQSYLGKTITSMKQKMSDFQNIMDDYQSKLYKQYDAMETAIAKLNSQTSYISNAFSGS